MSCGCLEDKAVSCQLSHEQDDQRSDIDHNSQILPGSFTRRHAEACIFDHLCKVLLTREAFDGLDEVLLKREQGQVLNILIKLSI